MIGRIQNAWNNGMYNINKNKVDSLCPRHRKIEDWDYVARCRCADDKRNGHFNQLRRELTKLDVKNEDGDKINNMLKDILQYFDNRYSLKLIKKCWR